MPSANARTNSTTTSQLPTIRAPPDFSIAAIHAKDVEGLVMEIKENLRISAGSLKAIPAYRRYPKKFLRNSPYGVRSSDGSLCKPARKAGETHLDDIEDPYDLLQRLLKDGSLVNEAVRRVQLGLTPKQQYYYESDDETSPVLRLCSQEN